MCVCVLQRLSIIIITLVIVKSGSSAGQNFQWCDCSAPPRHRCQLIPIRCAVSTVTPSPPLLRRLHRLLQRQAGARRREGHHHGLDATQSPRKQAQEVVLVVCVQREAEGPLRRCRRRIVGVVVPRQGSSRRWRRMLGREMSGQCAPGERKKGERT